jgi:hypothetical protein
MKALQKLIKGISIKMTAIYIVSFLVSMSIISGISYFLLLRFSPATINGGLGYSVADFGDQNFKSNVATSLTATSTRNIIKKVGGK